MGTADLTSIDEATAPLGLSNGPKLSCSSRHRETARSSEQEETLKRIQRGGRATPASPLELQLRSSQAPTYGLISSDAAGSASASDAAVGSGEQVTPAAPQSVTLTMRVVSVSAFRENTRI